MKQPDGQISATFVKFFVQPHLQKYFASPPTQISSLIRAVLTHRGALRNVINAGQDAVDAEGAGDESAGSAFAKASAGLHKARRNLWRGRVADGEVVWS
jgi:hypothetical protein